MHREINRENRRVLSSSIPIASEREALMYLSTPCHCLHLLHLRREQLTGKKTGWKLNILWTNYWRTSITRTRMHSDTWKESNMTSRTHYMMKFLQSNSTLNMKSSQSILKITSKRKWKTKKETYPCSRLWFS